MRHRHEEGQSGEFPLTIKSSGVAATLFYRGRKVIDNRELGNGQRQADVQGAKPRIAQL